MKTTSTAPDASQKSPREVMGWKYMLAGFFVVLTAGIVYFVGPRSANPALYGSIGNYLMAAGLVVYVVGRVLRWRGRRERDAAAKSGKGFKGSKG